jgi:transposase-like protein
MSMLSKKYFQNEKAAFRHLEGILWANGRVCPHCGVVDRSGRLEGIRSKPSKKNPQGVEVHGRWKCYACRKQFTVMVGTVFERAHIPLHKMLQAVYLMASSKKGISAHQLHRVLEITYKSAWFLAHRIREAMRPKDFTPMGGSGRGVEVDETVFGFQKGMNSKSRQERNAWQFRNIVLTLVERGGSARSFHVDGTTTGTLVPILRMNIRRESMLLTDQASWYKTVGTEYAEHGSVDHSKKEYARGEISTNTVEGYFSIFKRGMKGVYQHCSEKHLHRYLSEFDFRYSNRVALGVNDEERSERAMKGIVGKRLTYRAADTSQSAPF